MIDSRSTSRAMISVIEKARGRSDARPSSRLLSVVLMAVFFIALMGGLAAGATMYRAATRAQATANELHLQTGLITNVIRANDVEGGVSEGEGPEGPSLVLTRTLGKSTYETRMYVYQGQLVQETAVAGKDYDPRSATPLLATSTFDFSIEGNRVSITCDQGTFAVTLRCSGPSTQGGAA